MHQRLATLWAAIAPPSGPVNVVDVGAHDGSWAVQTTSLLPAGSRVLCFEANPEHAESLARRGLWHRICLLGDRTESDVPFFRMRGCGPGTGDSIFRELTGHYADASVRGLAMTRLDDDPTVRALPGRVHLLKLDVQGAELLVLDGASDVLANTDAVAMEVSLLPYNQGAPGFADAVAYMKQRGFVAVDVLDIHYVRAACAQVDLLFVREGGALHAQIATRVRGP